ncbi:hypothetical protein LTR86_008104 [Recurvomyces mirabilis]|nr:hypothetical protein LTR86_008104 [Recurvomyces mirabilis]
MRLINIDTLAFEEYYEGQIPSYAILSHRWAHGEIMFSDFRKARRKDSSGYWKVIRLIDATRRYNTWIRDLAEEVESQNSFVASGPILMIQHVWIDTCCIDKRSSADLSEAINSMFRWYANASICFVHLHDLQTSNSTPTQPSYQQLARSVWFGRGWTLQELLAPQRILFCNADWQFAYHKCNGDECDQLPRTAHINQELADATGIQCRSLYRLNLDSLSAAQIFSWGSRRQTTRIEDLSYCLLGLLQVNMPLLYGEGPRAFLRLQQEVLRTKKDETIFVHTDSRLLGGHPLSYARSTDVLCLLPSRSEPLTISQNTLQLTAQAMSISVTDQGLVEFWIIPLRCTSDELSKTPGRFAILVSRDIDPAGTTYRIVNDSGLPDPPTDIVGCRLSHNGSERTRYEAWSDAHTDRRITTTRRMTWGTFLIDV